MEEQSKDVWTKQRAAVPVNLFWEGLVRPGYIVSRSLFICPCKGDIDNTNLHFMQSRLGKKPLPSALDWEITEKIKSQKY
jgi:hypothetical protein